MKNLIVVVATHGVLKHAWAVRSVRSILNYAENIGAACEIHTEQRGLIKPLGVTQVPEAFEKFDVLRRTDFDSILTLDCDLLVRRSAPSIFDRFNQFELCAMDESNVVDSGSWTAQLWSSHSRYLSEISFPRNDNGIWRYSNTGVVLSTRDARRRLIEQNQSMRRSERRKIGFNTDQSYFSILAHKAGFHVGDIGSQWNGLVPVLGSERLDHLFFLHFAGNSKDRLMEFAATDDFW